jgi:predicted RNA-binding Zn ribbon-like protein
MAQDGTNQSEGGPVRFGGRETATGLHFELTGGALCLDFVNTKGDRPTVEPRELLLSYQDLVLWGVQAGAIPDTVARRLGPAARADAAVAHRALEHARQVREALFPIFSAVAAGRTAPAAAAASLNAALPRALAARRLELGAGSPSWVWVETSPPDLDRVLWPVVVSAAELLTSSELDRVRECPGERCAWLFLDRSRNRSRRWCDMSVCGNRSKARRHHARQRGG